MVESGGMEFELGGGTVMLTKIACEPQMAHLSQREFLLMNRTHFELGSAAGHTVLSVGNTLDCDDHQREMPSQTLLQDIPNCWR